MPKLDIFPVMLRVGLSVEIKRLFLAAIETSIFFFISDDFAVFRSHSPFSCNITFLAFSYLSGNLVGARKAP